MRVFAYSGDCKMLLKPFSSEVNRLSSSTTEVHAHELQCLSGFLYENTFDSKVGSD